jgi:hypothetical protein
MSTTVLNERSRITNSRITNSRITNSRITNSTIQGVESKRVQEVGYK